VLVLGGGGMKGVAHVGAWKAIEEAGIRVDAIMGCSIGALVGCTIAGGHGWRELAEIARALKKDDIVSINRRAVLFGGVREEAVFDGPHYLEYIRRTVPLKSFGDARIPGHIVRLTHELGRKHIVTDDPRARVDTRILEVIFVPEAGHRPLPLGLRLDVHLEETTAVAQR